VLGIGESLEGAVLLGREAERHGHVVMIPP
jgi:hypothetical protein